MTHTAKPGETEGEFVRRMNDMTTGALASVGISLGLDLGLFDALCELDQQATAQEVAAIAGCKTRYVQEWLLFMNAIDVVTSDDGGEYFQLPAHRRKGLNINISESGSRVGLLVFLPQIQEYYLSLKSCFKAEGPPGVDTRESDHFFQSFLGVRTKFFEIGIDEFIDQVPGLKEKLECGIRVLDVGCAWGESCMIMGERFPASTFTGLDLNTNDIQKGQRILKERNITNVELVAGDVTQMPEDWCERFDYATFVYTLHDLPGVKAASQACRELYRVLKPGGIYSVVDPRMTSNPNTPMSVDQKEDRLIWLFFTTTYCTPTTLHDTKGTEMYGGLGQEKTMQIMEEAGFNKVRMFDFECKDYAHGQTHFVCYK